MELAVYDIKWVSTTAGPSPDGNRRTELFLRGCRKAAEGNPCKNCFNPKLWKKSSTEKLLEAEKIAEGIAEKAPNRYITIVGGEPLDQPEALTELCEVLKEKGFHIILFTHYSLEDKALRLKLGRLLHSIDILIDGEYIEAMRIYDESTGDGLHDAVGSANQIIWDVKDWNDKNGSESLRGYSAGSLAGIYVTDSGKLCYITNEAVEDTKAAVA